MIGMVVVVVMVFFLFHDEMVAGSGVDRLDGL